MLLSLLVCAMSLLQDPAPRETPPESLKFRMPNSSEAGDLFTISLRSGMGFKGTVTVDGAIVEEIDYTFGARANYRQRIHAVDEGGWPTHATRSYAADLTEESDKGKPKSTKRTELHGATITFRRESGRAAVTSSRGALSPEEQQSLEAEFVALANEWFPSKGVGTGEEWSVTSRSLAATFGVSGAARLKGRFVEIVRFRGHRCARLAIEISVQGKMLGEPTYMRANLAGDAFASMDILRPMGVRFSGPLTISAIENEGKSITRIDAGGTLSLNIDYDWLKVAGRPIPVSPRIAAVLSEKRPRATEHRRPPLVGAALRKPAERAD